MTKRIVQFGFEWVSPESMNWGPVLDCRVIQNPWVRGTPDEVLIRAVEKHPLFEEVVQQGIKMLEEHDVIYVGCQFGKHRSGAVATEIAKRLQIIVTNSRREVLQPLS